MAVGHLTNFTFAVRVENEHVGNADQYRVTREMPLPYSFDNAEPRDDSDDDENDKPRRGKEPSDAGMQNPQSRESFVEPQPELRSVRLTSIASVRSQDAGQMA